MSRLQRCKLILDLVEAVPEYVDLVFLDLDTLVEVDEATGQDGDRPKIPRSDLFSPPYTGLMRKGHTLCWVSRPRLSPTLLSLRSEA